MSDRLEDDRLEAAIPQPWPSAIVQAIAAIQPNTATLDELGDHVARFTPLVKALNKIKRGVEEDGEALASAFVLLRPPTPRPDRLTAAEMAEEVERLWRLLDGFDPRSWFVVAMQAHKHGYYLPSAVDTMFRIVDESATKLRSMPPTRRGRASSGHAVADACASLYYTWTGYLPKIFNYQQLGACNEYGELVQVAFEVFELGGSWGRSATLAARNIAAAVNADKKGRNTP